MPWCKTEGDLDEFIAEIKALPRSKRLAVKKAISLNNKKPEQIEKTVEDRLPVLTQISAATFLNILKGWEDSGPSGSGGGTYH